MLLKVELYDEAAHTNPMKQTLVIGCFVFRSCACGNEVALLQSDDSERIGISDCSDVFSLRSLQ